MSPQPDHAEASPSGEGPKAERHLVITVHGIRTFGQWQERLEKLLPAEPGLTVKHYHYGYFSVIAFLIPFLRWLVTRRFRQELLHEARGNPGARIDLVAHSFGTHLVAWALLGLRKEERPRVHTIILAGSVLKVGFSWRLLMDDGSVRRVINDCGTTDSVLLLNQLVVLFTGMAGRVGFNGITERERFLNRYFPFGHSGYFQRDGQFDDAFMREHWVPLLAGEGPPEPHDERELGGALRGLQLFLLNNAEPVKLAIYLSPLVALVLVYYGLYRQAETARAETEYTAAVGLLRPLDPQSRGLTSREVEALTQLATLPKPQERVRIRFVEAALSDPGRAVRFAGRAPTALQAAVGLDPARREKAAAVLRKPLENKDAPFAVRVAAALAVAELNLEEGPLNEQATEVLAKVLDKGEQIVPPSMAAQALIRTTHPLAPEKKADSRERAARALADALGKETDAFARRDLIWVLRATPEGLSPAAAAKMLAGALGKETEPFARQALARGLAEAAKGLPPEQRGALLGPAAQALAGALGKKAYPSGREGLARGLAEVAKGLPPDRGTPLLLRHIASYAELKELFSLALTELAQRCSLEESIKALKHPFCCGSERVLFLRRVGQLTGQTFRTRWEMVDWLRKNHPEIDLSAPPHLEK